MKLEFFVRDLRMTRKGLEPLVGDTSGYYTFTIAFDRAWDGLVKVVVFQNGDQTAQMIYKGESRLPPQVSGAGELYVACHGYRREGDQVAVLRTLSMVKPVRLRPSGPMEGDTAQIGTPSLYAQVMGAVGQAEAIRQELIEARDSGAFIGPPGQPGKDAEVPEKLPNPYPLSLTINGVEMEYDGSEAVVAQVRLNETNWGTAIMKRLQEHDQSGEAHPDIREAIPERLPNPHPLSLTINGVEVEYDGSKAVAAQIAGTANSGTGCVAGWQLVQELTLDEELAVELTVPEKAAACTEWVAHLAVPSKGTAVKFDRSTLFFGASGFVNLTAADASYGKQIKVSALWPTACEYAAVEYKDGNTTDTNPGFDTIRRSSYAIGRCNVYPIEDRSVLFRSSVALPAGTKLLIFGR